MHTLFRVYREMMLEVLRFFPGQDWRSMTLGEIRFLYEGIRGNLREATKPKKRHGR